MFNLNTLNPHGDTVEILFAERLDAAMSPDGHVLAAASGSLLIRLWKLSE